MDGVLIDVTQSYNQAIKLTIKKICNQEVMGKDIVNIKQIAGFNNDWDTSYALIQLLNRKVPKNSWKIMAKTLLPIDRKTNLYQQIFEIFQTYYLGSDLYQQSYQKKAPFEYKNGLITKEKCLVNPQLLTKSRQLGYKLAIATGRPKFEALAAIKIMKLDKFFTKENTVALEDTKKEKPSPEPLLLAQEKINANGAIYIGDSVSDKMAAKAAEMDFYYINNQDKKTRDSFSTVNDCLKQLLLQ